MTVKISPSPGYAVILRVRLENRPGALGQVTTAIGGAEGDISSLDIVEQQQGAVVRDITVQCRDEDHAAEIAEAVRGIDEIELLEVTDRIFQLHKGGKLEIESKHRFGTREDLAMLYTPGVGRVSQAIANDPKRVWELTIRQNSVAVLTDGSAVLGLGDVGPEAALPVMEGKALLFKKFGDIDAFPLCLRVKDTDAFVARARALAPGFGAINLENIAAPHCFELEQRLQEELDIPVIHDDQHGTSISVLAALYNATKVVDKPMGDVKVVIVGLGAGGIATARLLLAAGVGKIVGCDTGGIAHTDRDDLNPYKRWVAEHTNPEDRSGGIPEALEGADVLIGLSVPGAVEAEWLTAMADDAIVFALANPDPEVRPEEMPDNVAVVATGRSDYPNQINNVLVFPGMFRGLLDSRAQGIDLETQLAAAYALADLLDADGVSPDYIVPSIFDERVTPTVADTVRSAVSERGLDRPDRSDVGDLWLGDTEDLPAAEGPQHGE